MFMRCWGYRMRKMDAKDKAEDAVGEASDARFLQFLESYRQRLPIDRRDYIDTHDKRFLYTLRAIPTARDRGSSAIEVGTYGVFLVALRDLFGYDIIEGTIYEQPGAHPAKVSRRFDFDPKGQVFTLYDIDVERTQLPVPGESFDFVLLAEVLEHFATDPNAFFFEANRVLKPGGRILVTTPNVACDENIFRILWRQVPHRYYYYRKEGTSDRHNLEYGPDLLKKTMENAGFSVQRMWDEDCWCEQRPEILKLIRDAGFPDSFRGDDMMFLCVKTGTPQERFPDFLYA